MLPDPQRLSLVLKKSKICHYTNARIRSIAYYDGRRSWNDRFFILLTAHKRNCAELYKSGKNISGVYKIDPDGLGPPFDVFCDQTTARGGWTVFQKRLDGSVNFYRGWSDYKRGFGNLSGEYLLGLDKIYRLTKLKNTLRVDLEDTKGKTAYAAYDMFAVAN